ncbi:hypothetical protein FA09DRAFT_21755 [Tilletiopsis washingtonensis]|uniref:Uncharacterized protein n=1 Tax=Tilletiopsis washingtonensis TaxID=58919 RepID=A0A316ZB15_9BASI|nr:hypothetical protein FA09DRAFT_21755 [Tilletiopsis washingtonensis]PWN98214.1 hypothetical protein FA09DRAFT_21755 [Tilletiopsis washingtonensis]
MTLPVERPRCTAGAFSCDKPAPSPSLVRQADDSEHEDEPCSMHQQGVGVACCSWRRSSLWAFGRRSRVRRRPTGRPCSAEHAQQCPGGRDLCMLCGTEALASLRSCASKALRQVDDVPGTALRPAAAGTCQGADETRWADRSDRSSGPR